MAGRGWMLVWHFTLVPATWGCPAHAVMPPHGGCRGMLGTAALPPCTAVAVTVELTHRQLKVALSPVQ